LLKIVEVKRKLGGDQLKNLRAKGQLFIQYQPEHSHPVLRPVTVHLGSERDFVEPNGITISGSKNA
jgi:hypothetical protein